MTAFELKEITGLNCHYMEQDTGYKFEWMDGTLLAKAGDEAMQAAIAWMNARGFTTRVVAIAGASFNHNILTANLMRILGNHLRGNPCVPMSSDIKVRVSEADVNTFPDVVVACPPHQWDEEIPNTLLNPTLIIEVLSPTTRRYDEGDKWEHYRRLSSLQEYILVSSDRVQVQHFVRQSQNDGRDWLLHFAESREETLFLPSIEAALSLNEIYERIDFEAA